MFTRAFWVATAERAVKTFCQSLAVVGLAGATDLLAVDWGNVLSVAGLTALVSVLTSIGSGVITSRPGPSLTDAETLS